MPQSQDRKRASLLRLSALVLLSAALARVSGLVEQRDRHEFRAADGPEKGDELNIDADGPTDIPARGWKQILLNVKDELGKDHVGLIAAGVAFYALLAIFPALTALLALAGLVLEPSQITTEIERAARLLPDQAAEIVLSQLSEIAGSRETGLGLATILGFGIALYSASKGMGSLIEGLNVAFDTPEQRGFLHLKLLTLGLTAMVVLGAVFAIFVITFLPVVLGFLALGDTGEVASQVAAWALLLAGMLVALALIFAYGPSREAPEIKWVTPGAIMACVGWLAASLAFSIYIRNFADYNESFGALGGVIVLLTWLWMSAYIVLIGAELDSEVEDAALDPPSGSREAAADGSF